MKLHRANQIFAAAFYPFLLLYLVFALPIIGNFAFPYFVDDLIRNCGAPVSGSGFKHCYLNGVDIGELSYNYGTTILAMGLFNPVYAFTAIKALIPKFILLPWVVLIGFSYYLKKKLA